MLKVSENGMSCTPEYARTIQHSSHKIAASSARFVPFQQAGAEQSRIEAQENDSRALNRQSDVRFESRVEHNLYTEVRGRGAPVAARKAASLLSGVRT